VGQEGELRPMANPQASKAKRIEGLPFKGGGGLSGDGRSIPTGDG
jgi:hypothetical protein